MRRDSANSLRDTVIPLALLVGDSGITFAGLCLGYWLRYASPLSRIGVDVPNATFPLYLPLLLVGVALLIAAFAQFGLYDTRLILRRYQSLNAILKGSAFWLIAYLGLSLVLKFDPPISRLFAVIAFGCVIALLAIWRSFTYAAIVHTPLVRRLRRRAVLLGWNADAQSLADEISRDSAHPLSFAGSVAFSPLTESAPQPRRIASPQASSADAQPVPLGTIDELETILTRVAADVVILTQSDLPRQRVENIVETCERLYVEWKIVPGAFDIFLSGLKLQTIGRVPVLGIEELAINRLFNRGLKRFTDIVGALIGLVLSAPLIAILALLIKRESPGSPVLFQQQRIGANHRPFMLYKLRSMVPGAESHDSLRQSTAREDPRLLRIGAWLRKWNLDELPQFWNVLRGDMSLVGPRPERPYHVEKLSSEIPHYHPRHIVKPGMTGWAQINGFRGDSSIVQRIQHDIYYIENWSIWLDVQILLLTFVRWKNAY